MNTEIPANSSSAIQDILLSIGTGTTEDLSVIFQKLSSMTPEERKACYNTKTNERWPQPQIVDSISTGTPTVAQKLYAMIYKYEREKELEAKKAHKSYLFDPFQSGIDGYFPDKKLAEEFRDILKIQRQKRQAEIKKSAMDAGLSVYHISSVPPEKIEGGILRPREQEEHFRDQGKVKAVFASSDSNWAMALNLGGRVPGGIATSVISSSLFGTKKIVTVSDKNKFLNYKSRHPYSYQYKFPVELFEPNVGYNGFFNGEWYTNSAVPVSEKNCEKKTVDEIVSTDADLYFITPGQVNNVYVQLNSQVQTTEQLVERGSLIPYKIGDVEKWGNERKGTLFSLLKVLGTRLENSNSHDNDSKKVNQPTQQDLSQDR
ncbi:MAG: hypothetical protein J6Y85_05505 [Alphaproteobacteria bacterium]|nr:hypothetical protein [Alphaproteobacteria bacterium]